MKRYIICYPFWHRIGKITGIRQLKYPLSILIFLLSHSSFASGLTTSAIKDTAVPNSLEHRLTREQFYETYGRDDSSRALIGFYFYKRNKAKKMALAGLAAAIISLVVFGLVVSNNSTTSATPGTADNYSDLGLVLVFGLAFYGSWVLIIMGTVVWMIYSRKKLLRQLKDYYAGHSIPGRITRSRLFRQWMGLERARQAR